MSTEALLQPDKVQVSRTELRQNLREELRRAKGRTVLLVTGGNGDEEPKCVVDSQYFDELIRRFKSLQETFEIIVDRRLFNQILAVAETLDEDVRLGRLHSFEEAFGED